MHDPERYIFELILNRTRKLYMNLFSCTSILKKEFEEITQTDVLKQSVRPVLLLGLFESDNVRK